MHVNIHLAANAKKERARVLNSPLHIGNDELRRDIQPVADGNGLNLDCHFMILAMNSEDAMDARLGQLPLNVIRNEYDVRIPSAFENVLVHLLIPCFAAANAALGVDNDRTGAFAGRKIVMNRSLLQFERTMNGVKNVTQRELDLCLGWNEFEHCLLSKQHRPHQ